MRLSGGRIWATAPTHVAVDNFAARIYAVSAKIADRYNEGLAMDDKSRLFRQLVVRAHPFNVESEAFWNVLEHGAPFPKDTRRRAKFELHLSMAYWLLLAFGSTAVEAQLHADDTSHLQALRTDLEHEVESVPDYAFIFAVVKKEITWVEFTGKLRDGLPSLDGWFGRILDRADILCGTPGLGCNGPFRIWREMNAKGIAVDEAANMTRPDLYSSWGNTLLPCALAGDDKQLPPAIITGNEPWEFDKDGKTILSHHNRFTADGRISPLEFLKGAGFPVYRLRTQLRMAKDMFYLCHKNMYNDIEHVPYGPKSDISGPDHDIGRALEAYAVEKYTAKGFKAAPAEVFQPIFINCPGSRTFTNETGSKFNRDQSEAALDFIKGFVEAKMMAADRIVVITPYKANVQVMDKMRSFYPTLAALPPCPTVDSFQGQEGDVCVVVLGTTKQSGPGFTTDSNRLNVAISRQKSGLIIVGDINTTGAEDRAKNAAKNAAKNTGKKGKQAQGKKADNKFLVTSADGEQHFTKAVMLDNVYTWFLEAGRVVEVPCGDKKAPKDKEEDGPKGREMTVVIGR